MKTAFAPREKTDVVEWCEEHVADIPYSMTRGRFTRTPMLAEVMRAICDVENRKIVLSACVQSGKTLAPELALCWIVANDPGPALWLDIKDESAKDQSETRVQPLFRNCAPVRGLFPENKDKLRTRSIIFKNGMPLWFAGARNKNNLQRRSIRYVFGDETWLWPKGHMAEAEARTTAFGELGKCVFMSQGSFLDDDTDRAFKATDAREWMFRCPKCGEIQPFAWERLEWTKKETLAETLETVRLRCRKCDAEFTADERERLNADARFVPTNDDAPPGTVGFHWNALATMDWKNLLVEYLNAKKISRKADVSALREFVQKRLAEPWGKNDRADDEEFAQTLGRLAQKGYRFGDPWDDEAMFDKERSTWISRKTARELGTENAATPLRFLTVDVQEAHFYYVVRAWNRNGDSRLVARGMTMDVAEIENVRKKMRVEAALTFFDAHYKTQIVKTLCVKNGYVALMGDKRDAFPHKKNAKTLMRPFSKKILISGNVPGKTGTLYYFSNRAIKDTLAEIRAGKTQMKWEIPADVDITYFKQINAEFFDDEKNLWVCPEGRDNHFFDCETMQIAAALMLRIIGAEAERSENEK